MRYGEGCGRLALLRQQMVMANAITPTGMFSRLGLILYSLVYVVETRLASARPRCSSSFVDTTGLFGYVFGRHGSFLGSGTCVVAVV